MALSIFDIAKGIFWTDEYSTSLQTRKKTDASWILIEYLNISREYLEFDREILNKFNKIIESKNRNIIENYIVKELSGFREYSGEIFAFIAGATDLSPSILYSIENNSFLIIHPNLYSEGEFSITLDDLLSLINQKIILDEMILNLKLRKH